MWTLAPPVCLKVVSKHNHQEAEEVTDHSRHLVLIFPQFLNPTSPIFLLQESIVQLEEILECD